MTEQNDQNAQDTGLIPHCLGVDLTAGKSNFWEVVDLFVEQAGVSGKRRRQAYLNAFTITFDTPEQVDLSLTSIVHLANRGYPADAIDLCKTLVSEERRRLSAATRDRYVMTMIVLTALDRRYPEFASNIAEFTSSLSQFVDSKYIDKCVQPVFDMLKDR